MYGHDMHSLYSFTSAIDRTVSFVDSAIVAMAVAIPKDPLHQAQEGASAVAVGGGSGGGGGRGGGGHLIQAAQSGTCS